MLYTQRDAAGCTRWRAGRDALSDAGVGSSPGSGSPGYMQTGSVQIYITYYIATHFLRRLPTLHLRIMFARLTSLLALASVGLVAAQEAVRFGVVSVQPTTVKAGDVRPPVHLKKVLAELT